VVGILQMNFSEVLGVGILEGVGWDIRRGSFTEAWREQDVFFHYFM